MSVIKIENLSHIYSKGTPFEKVAIDHINLEIEEGELVGVIGHTGSGKSTLIQHLNGLLKPTSGRILIDGENIWSKEADLRAIRFKVGLVFQYPEYQLFEETVYKDIAFGPRNMGLDEDEIDKRVRSAAEVLGIRDELLHKSPFELSGGQKRRVAIAGVIAMSPKVLILDEPTAGLDPRGREKVLGMLLEYHNRTNSTVIIVSHSMEDISRYTKKVLVMNKAQVFMYDTVDKVFAHSKEIEKIGLTIPQISRVFRSLRERGFEVNPYVYTVQQAKEELLAVLKKGGRNDA